MAQSRFVRVSVIILSALVLASNQPRAQTQPRRTDHVIILMLDGTRPDFLRDVSTPTIDGLMAAGTVYTQAETTYPSQTRVAFVTLPTGSYPGHHGIVGAGTIKDPSWESLAMGDEDHPEAMQALVARPTFFEEATAAGLTSLYAGMKGYELVGARGATWTINGHRTLDSTAYVSRYEPEVLGSRQLAHFYKQQLSRQFLDQSLAIFKEHKPDLSIINVGSADYSAHSFGPDTVEYRETLRYIDGLIATLLKQLDDLKLRDRTTIIISADHGFSQVDGRNVVAPVGTQGPPQLDALSGLNIEHLVSNTGGTSMGVYIRDKARVGEAATAIRKQPWFEAMYCEDPQVGCSKSLSELHAYFPGRSPDLMVDIDDDATLNYPRSGNHGSLRPSDMRIPLILSGAGIAKGARFGKASLIDVAPTVVKLLGLPGRILKPDGRVLEEALLP